MLDHADAARGLPALLAALLALAAAACEPLAPNPEADVSGEWAFTSYLSIVGADVCSPAGSLLLTQQRPTLTGSAYQYADCAYPTSTEIAHGTLGGADLRFTVGECEFTGTVYGDPAGEITGSVSCQTPSGLAQGNWSASPAGPPLLVEQVPLRRRMVPGAAYQATASILDSRSHRLGRPLTWSSSNPAVATVSATGMVTAGTEGTADISVAVGEIVQTSTVTVRRVRLTTVAAGGTHSCGLSAGGPVSCWGGNDQSQLGDGAETGSTAPVGVDGDPGLASVVAGDMFSCGLMPGGAAYCWGGQPRRAAYTGSARPAPVVGSWAYTTLAVGAEAVGVSTSGTTLNWWSAQFASGSLAGPAAITTSQVFTALATGETHSCGITAAGAAWCWGYNYTGVLGTGDTITNQTPVAVAGGLTFTAIAVGTSHSCGLVAGGAAYCWGQNQAGQFGDGSTTRSLKPTPAAGGLSFVALSASHNHTCGLGADGRVWCWGSTLAGSGDSMVPVEISGSLRFTSVSAGADHACGVATDGLVYCWGKNTSGQLGDGTTVSRAAPVRVIGQR